MKSYHLLTRTVRPQGVKCIATFLLRFQGSALGNHYVALVSPITFNLRTVTIPGGKTDCFRDPPGPRICVTSRDTTYEEGTVSFKVYTWGKVRNVPWSGSSTVLGLIKSYYGFVASKY
jgi:hypothetical protein